MSDHIGRSFDGHPLEDACPCPQEPCGLIDVSRIDPTCGQHSLAAGKTIRQSHTPERCPVTAPTSPKPHTPSDPNDLRTALTKLADEHDAQTGPYARILHTAQIRALLAAHPTQPQTGSLAEYRDAVARNHSAASWMRDDFLTDMDEWMTTHPAPVSDTRREDVEGRNR